MSQSPMPGVATLDGMVNDERDDPASVLAESDYDTELGLVMAGDAQRVGEGKLSGEAFWEKYDEVAREEFGDEYTETPNPSVLAEDQTIDESVASDLSCDVGDMESVAAELDGEAAVESGERETKWGMVIDLQKCVGCDSCTVACKAENRTPPGVSYNVVMEKEHGEYPNVSRTNVPRPCMQCENPPCVQVCPVSATYKMENGIVNIDYDRCIGCRYCMIACPYGARYFDFGESYDDEVVEADEITSPEFGVNRDEGGRSNPVGNVRKCTFCYHRLERGEEPACVETCIGDARNAGDLADPESEVAKMAGSDRSFQLKEEGGTDPNVYYLR